MPLRPTVLVSFLALCPSGCGAGLLQPAPTAEIEVSISVSGGIAGADYVIVVDGASREVRGGACAALCEWQAGEVLLPISDAQVALLSRHLDASGIVELDGHDFGTSCCDFFHVEVTYVRGAESVSVRGTDDRFPTDLAAAVRLVMGFADGRAAMIVAHESNRAEWPREPYLLGEVDVAGLVLEAELSYSGGCAQHRFDLVALGPWLESSPVQIEALISHDDGGDSCEAWITDHRRFDLVPLVEAYVAAFGATGPTPRRVVLRLWDPSSASPLGRLVEVELPGP